MAEVFPNTSCSYCNQLERIGEDQISSILNENEFLDAEILYGKQTNYHKIHTKSLAT